MELDELKKSWGKQKSGDIQISPEKFAGIIKNNVDTAGSSIRNHFIGEIIAAALIYTGAIIYLFSIKKHFNDFIYIFFILSAISIMPVIIKFIKSISFFKNLDYSLDIKHGLEKSLEYFKSTLKFCRWIVYFFSMVVVIILTLNIFHLSGGLWTTAGIIVYIVIVGLLTKPYINWLYGKQVRDIEKILDELKDPTQSVTNSERM